MPGKALVVDANILAPAVLGKRVRELMEAYAEEVTFFVPEAALAEAEEHLPALVIKRGGDPEKRSLFLRRVAGLVEVIGGDVYGAFEAAARERLGVTRSGRLADSGSRIGAWLSDLDRGQGFFRMRGRRVDLQQRGGISAQSSEVASRDNESDRRSVGPAGD